MIGDKRGAIEMSVGTIVTIVLAMTMLIGGIMLVKNIIGGGLNVVDLNNEQITSEIAKLYGDDKELVIYPNVDIFEVKPGKPTAFAIRIKNLIKGASGKTTFSYHLEYSDLDCGFGETDVNSWIKGESRDNIELASKDETIEKILLTVPEGTPLCSFRIIVVAKDSLGGTYNEQMYVSIV